MLLANRLPPTKSRTDASYVYLPDATQSDPNYGTLTVVEHRGTRVYRMVTDRYAVEPADADFGPGRAWFLSKTHHGGDLDTAAGRASASRVSEVYKCEVGEGYHRCTCTGGATEEKRRQKVEVADCVHVLAMRDLLANGAFDDAPHPLDRAANTGEDGGADFGELADRWEEAEEGDGDNGPDRMEDDWYAEALGGKFFDREPLGV